MNKKTALAILAAAAITLLALPARADQPIGTNYDFQGHSVYHLMVPALTKDPATSPVRAGDLPNTNCVMQALGSWTYGCATDLSFDDPFAVVLNHLQLKINTTLHITGGLLGVNGLSSLPAPTGTGFAHVTAGAWDPAARAVDLSGADATGVLAAARFPAQSGAVTNSTGSTVTAFGSQAAASSFGNWGSSPGTPAANVASVPFGVPMASAGMSAIAWTAITAANAQVAVYADGIVTGTTQLASVAAATMQAGTTAYVNSVDDFFKLMVSTATADNITIVAASGKSGYRWMRMGVVSLRAQLTTSWNVDPSGGNDENDGTVSALRTYAEWSRRTHGIICPAFVLVTQLNAAPDGDTINVNFNGQDSGSFVEFLGSETVVSTQTVSAAQARTPASNLANEITTASDLSAFVGDFVRVQSSTNYAVLSKAISAGHARLTELVTPTGAQASSGGVASTQIVEVLTTLKAPLKLNVNGSSLNVFLSDLRFDGSGATTIRAGNGNTAVIGQHVILGGTTTTLIAGGGDLELWASTIKATAVMTAGVYEGVAFLANAAFQANNQATSYFKLRSAVFQAATCTVSSGVLHLDGDFGQFDLGGGQYGIVLNGGTGTGEGSIAHWNSGRHYGGGNNVGAGAWYLGHGAWVSYPPATPPTMNAGLGIATSNGPTYPIASVPLPLNPITGNAVYALGGTTTAGFVSQNTAGDPTARTLTNTDGTVTILNGDGLSGNPVISTGVVPGASVYADGIVTGTTQLASVASLALRAGTIAYVNSVDDGFTLKVDTTTPDNITHVTASGKTGYEWVRMGVVSLRAQGASAWFIDPSGGNDENPGTSSGSALKTFAEFDRRTNGIRISAFLPITLMNDASSSDTFSPGILSDGTAALLGLSGSETVLTTRTVTSAQAKTPASNLANEITITGFDCSPYVGTFLRVQGTASYAAITKAPSLGVCRLGETYNSFTYVSGGITAGQVVEIVSPTKGPGVISVRGNVPLFLSDIHFVKTSGIMAWVDNSNVTNAHLTLRVIFDGAAGYQRIGASLMSQVSSIFLGPFTIGPLLHDNYAGCAWISPAGAVANIFSSQSVALVNSVSERVGIQFPGSNLIIRGDFGSFDIPASQKGGFQADDDLGPSKLTWSNLAPTGRYYGSGNSGSIGAFDIQSKTVVSYLPSLPPTMDAGLGAVVNGVSYSLGSLPIPIDPFTGAGIINSTVANGLMAHDSTGVVKPRTLIQGTGISIANGDGLAGNPTISLPNSGVTPGSYTSANITVDGTGRVTAAANGSSGGGGTVTDVGATAPVTSTHGTTPVIGMPAATDSTAGYMAAADKNRVDGNVTPTLITDLLRLGDLAVGGCAIQSSALGAGATFSCIPDLFIDAPLQVVLNHLQLATNITLVLSSGVLGRAGVTGDGNIPAGSNTFTLTNIPNATTAAGYINFTQTVAPTTPAVGHAKVWLDSTFGGLWALGGGGGLTHTMQTTTAVAHKFAIATTDAGDLALQQPDYSDLSGRAPGTISVDATDAAARAPDYIYNKLQSFTSSLSFSPIGTGDSQLTIDVVQGAIVAPFRMIFAFGGGNYGVNLTSGASGHAIDFWMRPNTWTDTDTQEGFMAHNQPWEYDVGDVFHSADLNVYIYQCGVHVGAGPVDNMIFEVTKNGARTGAKVTVACPNSTIFNTNFRTTGNSVTFAATDRAGVEVYDDSTSYADGALRASVSLTLRP